MSATYYKISKTKNGHAKYAYIEVTDDVVTAASPALAFMITWPLSTVRERAEFYQFRVTKMTRGSRNTTFITERPTAAQREAARNPA